MFKAFIIIFVVLWILVKLGGFFVRTFFSGLTNQSRQQSSQHRQQRKQPSDGNVSIDYAPKDKENIKDKDFRGGDYVDYEEV